MHLYPQPPTASVADFALAYARAVAAGGGANDFAGLAIPVSLGDLTAPSSATLAVIQLPSVRSGRFQFNFQLDYTDSAADTVVLGVGVIQGYTVGATGGTLTTGVRWESGAIVDPTGGALTGAPGIYGCTFAAGNLRHTASVMGVAVGLPNAANAILLKVSAAHNLSLMSLTASAYELA